MFNAEMLLTQIKDAIARDDFNAISTCVTTYLIDSCDLSDEYMAEDFFSGLLEVIESPVFQSMEGSCQLLSLFEYDWTSLSTTQKCELRRVLEKIYRNMVDYVSCVWIADMLGDYYADDDALRILCRLRRDSTADRRGILAMGIGKIARSSEQQSIRDRAFKELVAMQHDPSEAVRKEVAIQTTKSRRSG